MKSTKELLLEIESLNKETFDLIAKVIELINLIGWNDDGTYTFNDGDRWARFDPDYESALARASTQEVVTNE